MGRGNFFFEIEFLKSPLYGDLVGNTLTFFFIRVGGSLCQLRAAAPLRFPPG
jgi:hypothetical protein